MKNEQYFPFEVNMINNNNVSKLIEEHGPKGFGTYIMVITELRHSPDYRCGMDSIRGMARRCKVNKKLLESVINDFQLFELTHEGEDEVVASPYLDKVMKPYEDKHRKLSEAGAKGSNKLGRKSNGQFTSQDGALDKIRLDKTTTTPNVSLPEPAVVVVDADAVNTNDAGGKPWEEYLNRAMQDEAWVEVLAMNSGISKLFVEHRELAVEIFRQHVQLQGAGTSIRSIGSVKAYFANFLRPGTPTQKRMAALLAGRKEEVKQVSPYRYENIDPETGKRSYFGNPIPDHAPPRPNDNAVWSEELQEWI